MKMIANFQKKCKFLRSLWFSENENFAARALRSAPAAKLADLLELDS